MIAPFHYYCELFIAFTGNFAYNKLLNHISF